ncbi:RNA helicase [Caenorhabditis elegans]|uniref:RNA helicase n=1 Tax=Caenorhabditis elegans TaxID=6239 RepID=Q9N3H5_CAEEL|nr:RNA helicase [Caenorhabditis elegans]CCD62411.2 RNA helicase [Caenorhabditis elegans]
MTTKKFSQLGVCSWINQQLETMQIKTATPVQAACIPKILEGSEEPEPVPEHEILTVVINKTSSQHFGCHITISNGIAKVLSVIPGSPVDEALYAGDINLSIDGINIYNYGGLRDFKNRGNITLKVQRTIEKQ